MCTNFSTNDVKTKQLEHHPLASDDRALLRHETATFKLGEAGGQAEANEEVHHDDQQTTQELPETEGSEQDGGFNASADSDDGGY